MAAACINYASDDVSTMQCMIPIIIVDLEELPYNVWIQDLSKHISGFPKVHCWVTRERVSYNCMPNMDMVLL